MRKRHTDIVASYLNVQITADMYKEMSVGVMGTTATQTLFHDWGPCQEPTGKVWDFQPLP